MIGRGRMTSAGVNEPALGVVRSERSRREERRFVRAAIVASALFVATSASACAGGEIPTALAADPSNDAALRGLVPTLEAWTELSGAPAFSLRIANTGETTFENVRVVIDDGFAAPLGDLETYRGALDGTRPVGTSTLEPGDAHEFVFSHDTSNGHTLRDADDAPLSARVPERITIECTVDETVGSASWSVVR